MPSSISLSEQPAGNLRAPTPGAEAGPAIHEGALPRGLRLTASDRPGQAQPVPVRDIPTRPWKAIAAGALIAAVAMVGGWEMWARGAGLRTADVGDSPQAWAEQRVAVKPDDVVIVGDSRILFDTDLAHFERLTGRKPVQLAIHGTNGRVLMQDLAFDPDYRGLLIVGMADTSFFRPNGAGIGGSWIKDVERNREPSQITGLWLDRWIQGWFAFLDEDMRFSQLMTRLDHGWRAGVDSPYRDVWKVDESYAGRQRFMWAPIERPGYLQDQARAAWNGFKGKPIPPAIAAKVVDRSRRAAEALRSRGGEVVFIRPPSAPQLRVNEEARIPRRLGWDALLAGVPVKGVHFDDLPRAQKLYLPEWSHLSRACATVFTDAYVRRLIELTPRLQLVAGSPAPLSTADCVSGPQARP